MSVTEYIKGDTMYVGVSGETLWSLLYETGNNPVGRSEFTYDIDDFIEWSLTFEYHLGTEMAERFLNSDMSYLNVFNDQL